MIFWLFAKIFPTNISTSNSQCDTGHSFISILFLIFRNANSSIFSLIKNLYHTIHLLYLRKLSTKLIYTEVTTTYTGMCQLCQLDIIGKFSSMYVLPALPYLESWHKEQMYGSSHHSKPTQYTSG